MNRLQQTLRQIESEPVAAWERMQELRREFQPGVFQELGGLDRGGALLLAQKVTVGILGVLEEQGLDVSKTDPGHGVGHWARDFLNALCVLGAESSTFSSMETVVGFVGGVLHDVGCAFVPRYNEPHTPLRHAEVMTLILDGIFTDTDFDLPRDYRYAMMWGIAAHPHYTKPSTMEWRGVRVEINPYPDLAESGRPLYGVWLPRQIDRLECSGAATFPARHWLTLATPHQDYSRTDGFYGVVFADHVRPTTLRSDVEIKAAGGKRTMLEHLRMFADSQTNNSVYGRHDCGEMAALRDAKRAELYEFIRRVEQSDRSLRPGNVLQAWSQYLMERIEPSQAGEKAVHELSAMFLALPHESQESWAAGMVYAMDTYQTWSANMLRKLSDLDNRGLLFTSTLPIIGDIPRLLGA